MAALLRLLYMCPQFSLLISQTRLLLPLDRAALHDHHKRLIPRLLAVRRATRCGLVLLALERSVLFSSFASLLNRRDTLGVVRFRLLAGSKDVVLGDERVSEGG